MAVRVTVNYIDRMNRPRWVSALAITFTFVGLLLAGGALFLFQRVEVDHGDWFPGFAQGLDRLIAKFLLMLAIGLIVTGFGVWRIPVVAMRIAGSAAIGTSLLPFVFRFIPISVQNILDRFFVAGLALLTLGSLGVILRLALLGFGIGLVYYSRDAEIEANDAAIDG